MEGEANQKQLFKSKKGKFYLLVVLIILILTALGYFGYSYRRLFRKKTAETVTATPSADTNNFDQKTSSGSDSVTGNQSSSGDNKTPVQTSQSELKDANSYFDRAQSEAAAKNYTTAITDFQKAIVLDPNQEQYYLQESQAQVSNGNKNDAIATVQAGLKILPSSSLLQNRLAILQAVVK